MEIFYITIAITYILAFLGRQSGDVKEYNLKKINPFFFGLVTIIFILVCGLRSNIGDTYFYKHSYDLLVLTGDMIGYEIGFLKLMELLTKVSSDPQILIFTVGFICNLFILLSLKREATYFELSTYLFVTSGYYLVTMNGMRQSMVAGVFFYFGVKFIKEQKMFNYIALVFLLTLFHKSAVFLYPIYFISQEKAFSKRIVLLIGGTVFVTLMFSSLAGAIKEVSGEYGHYIDSFNEGGAHILRAAIDGVPVLLAYMNREKLEKDWKYSNIFINLSTLNFIFMILALQNWIFARVGLYLSISNFILLPYIIKNYFDDGTRKIVYAGCVIFYFLYYYYDQVIMMNVVYRSVILGIY
ncbi:MAG: EpsG family protein [Cetobacterium sp.]|uniref:EpsG family protein n=1 Tax=Cetobacterium sp. TaxID=2071632 RepID=UPI003EE62490